MYRHRPPQPGSQPFSSGPRPPRPPHQHRGSAPNIRGPSMNFQFPRPTQLPKELESALTIQGSRDMDHRTMDHRNMPNQHQGTGIGQGYGTNPMTSDNRSDQRQGADWSKYQPPNKLFAGSQPGRETENRAPMAANNPNWSGISNESQPRSTTGDAPGLYTSESAGSILASFGLSNEDLEVLSHYPDDQLTPDTLPFILRDIQINKSAPKTSTSSASPSFSSCNSDAQQRSALPSPVGHSNQEVPSLLTVTQTAGKVIDYGHASRADEECETRTAFKREQLSGERVVKILPSSPPRKVEKPDSRLVQVERTECGDKDYRKLTAEDRKSSRSREMDSPPKRNLDRDYRRERPTARTSSETRSESSSSKRSSSSTTGVKSHTSSKKLPTAAMIGDFSAQTPKVFPYTCSLCHMQCDQEKDWEEHLNTVNHTAACRELRTKYPQWKPYPSRSEDAYQERYTRHSSASRSRSRSPVHGSSHGKYRPGPHYYKPYRRSHSPHEPHHHHHYHHSYPGESSYRSARRPYDYGSKHYTNNRDDGPVRHSPPSSCYRTSSPESKAFKTSSGLTCKPPPAKKKKKVASPLSEKVECLLYLTGIPLDATEEDVTELVGSYGGINNVLLLPCTEEERQRGEGQKASVCMVRGEHAQALAASTSLFIREKPITVTRAKVPEKGSFDADNSTPAEKPGSEEEADKQKAVMLITGLPEGLWSTSDIVQLIQPFGSPSDIIEAKTLGKALVSVPNVEIADEIEKFHTVMPAKIHNTEIKVVHLKWHRPNVTMKTPVNLYNLLMGRANPVFDGQAQTSWNRLLVISNVPPSGHLEVEKLVRRFGTVIKTLPLHDVLICEMASVKMALSVIVRFRNFPCILQSNPLSFSRWPESKIVTDPKEEKKTAKTKPVKKKTDPAVKAVASDENEAQEDKTIQEDKLEGMSSVDVSAADSVTLSDNQEVMHEHASPSNDTEAPPGGDKPDTPAEMEELEPVVESNSEKNEVMESEEEIQGEVREAMKPGEGKEVEKQATINEGKESQAVEEKQDEAKRLKDARERKEKEVRERRIKERERERREKERRAKEEEKLRREREDKIRREKERREKERWERKRSYEDPRRSSRHLRRDEDSSRRSSSTRVEEEEQEEDFPFDLGDFVTVDEVGDVGDPPESPALVPMETDDAEQDGLQGSQKEETVTPVQPVATLEAKEGTIASGPIQERSLPPASSPSPAPQPESSQVDAPEDGPPSESSQDEPPQSESSQVEPLRDGPPPSGTPPDEPSQDELSPAPVEPPQDGPPPTGTSQDEPSQTETPVDELSPAETPQIDAPEDESSNQPGEDPETDLTPSDELLPTPPVEASLAEAPAAAEKKSPERETLKAEDQTMAPDTTPAQAQSVRPNEKLHTAKEPSAENESNGRAPTKSLPPYNPSTPVGLEFLVPKTGFFCKPCNRFFTGNREFEITHCKSLKHYQNLQEFLKHVTSS